MHWSGRCQPPKPADAAWMWTTYPSCCSTRHKSSMARCRTIRPNSQSGSTDWSCAASQATQPNAEAGDPNASVRSDGVDTILLGTGDDRLANGIFGEIRRVVNGEHFSKTHPCSMHAALDRANRTTANS